MNENIRDKRLREIQEAAGACFLEKGFSATSMEDIISRTSLSKGGFYHYYSSTIDILYDIMSRGNNYRYGIISRALEEDGDLDGDRIADLIVDRILDDNPYMPLYVIFLEEAKRSEKLKDLYYRLKEENVEVFSKLFGDLDGEGSARLVDDFMINFMNAIILGVSTLDCRDSFLANRQILKEMIKLYIKKI